MNKTAEEIYPYLDKLNEYDTPTLYLETAPNVFRVCSLNKTIVECTPEHEKKTDQYYTLKWKVDHYFITSSKSISLVDNVLIVKAASNPFKGKKFSRDEINAMDWRALKVKDKFGKQHKIA